MKRVISLCVVIGMVFSFTVFSSVASFAINETEIDLDKRVAFGIGDKTWSDNPQNNDEYVGNFLLAYCAGDWDYIININRTDRQRVSWSNSLKPYCILYNALLGAFTNQNEFYAVCMDGKYYIVTQGAEPCLSKDELMEQQESVYEKAVALRNQMVLSGSVSDDMTEKQKCEAYYKLLSSWNIPPSSAVTNIDYSSNDPSYRTIFMKYDSAYACLVNRVADCGGKSAGFSLLMNMEGIKSFGVQGRLIEHNSGHIVTYLVLDNEEYLSDYASSIRSAHVDLVSIKDKFEIDESYLSLIRKGLEIGESQDINDYAVISIKDERNDVVVSVTIDKDYFDNENTSYVINYGVEGNCMYTHTFSLDELKEGVTTSFPKEEIDKHNIPALVFIS